MNIHTISYAFPARPGKKRAARAKSNVQKGRQILSLFLLIPLLFLPVSAEGTPKQSKTYIPGGMPFGAMIYTDGLCVSALTEPGVLGTKENPSEKAGIHPGDIILRADGIRVSTGENLSDLVTAADGDTVRLTVLRNGKETEISVRPAKCKDGIWRLGVSVRDSAAGIGTVTFICPDTGAFGGLGHGICDAYDGDLLPMIRGNTENVRIHSVEKGQAGKPGEIHGSFAAKKTGTLIKNSDRGVFGILQQIPGNAPQPVEAAEIGEIRCGDATILCTLDGGEPKSYQIRIEEIRTEGKTRSFSLRVTDKDLLSLTGGIVRGMSGSPILQNGKLCGAVTHVMVNDPTRGFGIYIGNMLDELPPLLS